METEFNILVINPGSTSDEISFFHGEQKIFHKVVRYTPKDLEKYEKEPVTVQFEFRSSLVLRTLEEAQIDMNTIHAVIGRGGLLRPIPSGTYQVNEKILKELQAGTYGDHPSNLGGIIAHSIASQLNIPAFIADPVVVDEMDDIARFSGMPENPRVSILHALNQKRVARLAAAKLQKKYEECNLIVLHGGGGISIGAHRLGRIVDVNNALDGEGPFTPQRSGGVPAGGLVRMCFSGKYTLTDMKLKIKGHGGLVAYLGTSDLRMLENYLDGKELTEEEKSTLKPGVTREYISACIEAMTYQISKEICSMMAVFRGKVDAIVLTGGIVYDKRIVQWIRDRIEWAAPILTFPGGDEMGALRDAATRVLTGQETPRFYG